MVGNSNDKEEKEVQEDQSLSRQDSHADEGKVNTVDSIKLVLTAIISAIVVFCLFALGLFIYKRCNKKA